MATMVVAQVLQAGECGQRLYGLVCDVVATPQVQVLQDSVCGPVVTRPRP